MTNNINGIDVSKYFKNHYDSWGRLYCIEYKGNPLELQNAIKRLQEENEKLRQDWRLDCLKCEYKNTKADVDKYKQALEEIINIAEKLITETPEYRSCYYKDECGDNCTPKKQNKVEYCCYENVDKILTIINEVLNDRN